MQQKVKSSRGLYLVVSFSMLTACAVAQPAPPPPPPGAVAPADRHPAYLHALSDLRAARWLIEHRPGNYAETADEDEAVRQIDAAINDMKKAAFNDGKDINDHPPVDDHPDHRGRIHEALKFLRKARADVEHEEDNAYAGGVA